MPAGSILVDTNAGETPLYTALVARFGDAQVTRQRLDVGDVVLTSAEGVSVIVERKTYADWGKSLTDGRYAEQKARMLSALHHGASSEDDDGGEQAAATVAAVLYVVEGPIQGWAGTVGGHMGAVSMMTNAQLEAAIVMTSVRDGVPVLRASDAAHTAELVGYLYTKLSEGGALQAPPPHLQADGGPGYAALVKTRKRDNMTTATTWEVMLAQVPGMSATKAAAVAKAYPTLSALATAAERDLAAVLVPPASAPAAARGGGGKGGGAGGSGAGRGGKGNGGAGTAIEKKGRRLGPMLAKRLAALA